MLAPHATLGAGRYRLGERLGAGGMASVWLAHDERLERDVAIKLIADTLADDDAWTVRFEREAQAAASIAHPNVVSIFDFGFEDERPYLVMAYIEGPSLATALADGRAPDPRRFARELLDAVAHVHAAGIVHRDVKPANVLLDAGGSAHLTDFGIAQSPDATSLTQTGMVIGSLRYLAPEVADGAPATTASDLYAVGKVIGEVAESAGEGVLGPLVDRLTAPDPQRRPASAREALGLLDAQAGAAREPRTAPTRVLPSRPVAAGDSTHDVPALVRADLAALARWLRAHGVAPQLALATGAVTLLLLVVAIAAGGGEDRAAPPARSADGRPGAATSPDAPLGDQLDALDAAVDRAARR